MGLMNDSNQSPVRAPGLRNQDGARTTFRVLGVVFGLCLLFCGAMFVRGMVTDFGDDSMDAGFPTFFLWFLGVMVFLIPTFLCLNAGFGGVAMRYAAGESMPVVRDSASYLTDGEGLLGIGRTVDDAPRPTTADGGAARERTGPYCRGCGTRNDDAATFCDHCGASLA